MQKLWRSIRPSTAGGLWSCWKGSVCLCVCITGIREPQTPPRTLTLPQHCLSSPFSDSRAGALQSIKQTLSPFLSFSFLALTIISSLVPLLCPQALLPSFLHLLAVRLFWFGKHLLHIYCVPKHCSDAGQQRCISEDTLPSSPSSGFFSCRSQLSWVGQACVGSRLEGETASCQPWPRSLLPSALSHGLSPITFSVTLGHFSKGGSCPFKGPYNMLTEQIIT